MIGWVWPHVGAAIKFGVATIIILWFTLMTLIVFTFNDALTKRVDAQFIALQQDHREMRELLTRDLAKFGLTLQHNTDQAVKTAETAKKTAEIVKKLPDEIK
jgi:hypothetical protein